MGETRVKIIETEPSVPDALQLLNELSDTLESITGDSGKSSFNLDDVALPRSLFVLAYHHDEALGCGALRPIDENIGEVKRIYAKTKSKGVGSEILRYIETEARKLGYSKLRLETRLVNKQAVAFYENRGYHRIPNYGKYVHNHKAVCFEKDLYAIEN